MRYAKILMGGALMALTACASAQQIDADRHAASPTVDYPPLMQVDVRQQEACLTIMAGFPNDDTTGRYQFFKLVQSLSEGTSPQFLAALEHYGEGQVAADTPVLEVIDGIANPVLRQAMPSLTVAQSAFLINFALDCQQYVEGQTASLVAFDADLSDPDFNKVIAEDALFLRQILSESLYRLGAADDPVHKAAVENDAILIVGRRDEIEFASFDASVSDLESLYMDDLDGRLATINDAINSEMDREVLNQSVSLSKDMSRDAKEENERQVLRTLFGILNRY